LLDYLSRAITASQHKMERHWVYLVIAFLFLAGCGSRTKRDTGIGEGFVGPATLKLYKELGPHQPTVATVKHGERVVIIDKRRVFVKVRTSTGTEGWTDGRMLFDDGQMADLRWLAQQAARLPSQGKAIVFGKLNVHTHPNREAPSFMQLQEKEPVEVVAHRLVPRVSFQPEDPFPAVTESVPEDDWSLVRTQEGEAGWVLFRMLLMSIPDEVAQYAEGHRITSYFPLGKVKDRDKVKQNWLWTTISKDSQPYEFDSFRVFVWSRRRHRYETAYIERNIKGYYPVEAHAVEADASPSFSLIIEGKDNVLYRRTYAFQGYRVRMVSKEPWSLPDPGRLFKRPQPKPEDHEPQEKSFLTQLKETLGW
jgi:hypothetical protein